MLQLQQLVISRKTVGRHPVGEANQAASSAVRREAVRTSEKGSLAERIKESTAARIQVRVSMAANQAEKQVTEKVVAQPRDAVYAKVPTMHQHAHRMEEE